MTEAIVRTEDRDEFGFGLHLRYVLGLNIFEANLSEEEEEREPDPRVVFLRSLAIKFPCSAHVGLDQWGFDEDDIGEYLREAPGGVKSIPTPITLFYESMYPIRGVGGHFFPSAPLSLLDRHGHDLLFYSQLALYVGTNDRALSEMTYLLQPPNGLARPTGEGQQYDSQYLREWYRLLGGKETLSKDNEADAFTGEWLRRVGDLYALVIVPGHDGWDFEAYTRDVSQFDLLSDPIADAVRTIESSSWYQKHRAELYWDEESDQCLKLKT